MQRLFKYLFALLLIVGALRSVAQDTIVLDTLGFMPVQQDEIKPRSKDYSLFSVQVSGTVPHALSNGAFKKTFLGIYEINGGLNLNFYKGWFGGVVFKNNLFRINSKKIPNYNAGMIVNCAAVKLGGEFYINEKNTALFSFSIAGGQNFTRYTSLASKNPNTPPAITSFKSLYAEPHVGVYLFVEKNFALGIVADYTIIKRTFNPYELALNDWSAYSKTNTGPIQYFSFGFGLYYGFSTR